MSVEFVPGPSESCRAKTRNLLRSRKFEAVGFRLHVMFDSWYRSGTGRSGNLYPASKLGFGQDIAANRCFTYAEIVPVHTYR
jgi:hypothetical protein